MGRIDKIRESTDSIMRNPATSGRPHDAQMRQLMANNIEASALVHDEIAEFKKYVKKFGEKSDQFAKTGRLIALASLGVAIMAVIIALAK